MKIFTIFKCLIRFLNHLFTILKFLVDVMSVMWRKFPLTEVVNNGRTAAKSRFAQVLRNSPRAMPLIGFTNFCESAWMFSFLRCEAVWLATMNLLL